MKIKFALPILAFAVLLPGCATPDGIYPSLAIREGERMTGTMEPVEAQPHAPPVTSGEVLGRLDQLSGEAQEAHAAFLAEAPRARPVIIEGLAQGSGSDGWVRGQVALAGLETSRNKALIALADLDRLYADAVTDGTEITAIAKTRAQVLTLVAEEQGMLAAMTKGTI